MTASYPLTWPVNIPRQRTREKGAFRTTLPGALANVKKSLAAFGRDSGKTMGDIVISSNVTLGENSPADPGVAIWFVWDGMQVCIPVDRYLTVAANLQAIYLIIEARRTELRHGTLALVRATFTGFIALPPMKSANPGPRPWRVVMGFEGTWSPPQADIDKRYRELAKERGQDEAALKELNIARDEAKREISR